VDTTTKPGVTDAAYNETPSTIPTREGSSFFSAKGQQVLLIVLDTMETSSQNGHSGISN